MQHAVMEAIDSADAGCCRHDWQVYFDDPDIEACLWCGDERRYPGVLTANEMTAAASATAAATA